MYVKLFFFIGVSLLPTMTFAVGHNDSFATVVFMGKLFCKDEPSKVYLDPIQAPGIQIPVVIVICESIDPSVGSAFSFLHPAFVVV